MSISPPKTEAGIRIIPMLDVETYNFEELLNAAKEKRDPELIPNFSCHVLRHTFATRLCEAESNLKVIQSVMGHRNIETTMDIYAEATEEKNQETFEGLADKMDKLDNYIYEVSESCICNGQCFLLSWLDRRNS